MKKHKIFFIILALFLVINFSQWSRGKAASFVNSFEIGLEKEIGYYNYQSLIKQKRSINEQTEDIHRINRIFSQLVAHSSRNREVNFKLTVVNDPAVNAFALPGGYIFINSGLISFAKTDGELAGILGHEIAHVDRKHAMKALYRTAGMSAIWGLAVHKNNSKHKKLMNNVAGLSITLIQLGYSREAEFEADTYGVKLMKNSGYRKEDLLNFWHRMDEIDGVNSRFMQIFSTHPPIKDRIKNIETI